MNSEVEEQQKIQEKISQIESMAKKFMTQEAITRYATLKSVHQEKALQAIALIAQLGSQNKITGKIDDQQFKELLIKLEPEKRETKIIRK